MNDQLSLIQLVLHASWVVQLVMALLLLISVASWALIFNKYKQMQAGKKLNDAFEREFWSGTSLADLQAAAVKNSRDSGPMERVFLSGVREVQKLRERRITDSDRVLEGANRAMRAALQRELDEIEGGLSFLASVGSVSPYVGLFGTVWGIMSTFTTFGGQQQVTLATVAPGIAEALIATALGLLAAIPAVLAYNRFARDADKLATQMETFMDEFANILQRNHAAASPATSPLMPRE